jgi:CO/xanthine dehydrogenase FAD-binding subunit
MNPFEYKRVDDVTAAVEAISRSGRRKFLAGGTNLVDLMSHCTITA